MLHNYKSTHPNSHKNENQYIFQLTNFFKTKPNTPPCMDRRFLLVLIGTWFLFMILAIINAGIRNGVYKPIIGDLRAHQLSTLTFIIMILIVTYLVLRFSNLHLTDSQALIMGSIWLILTICFEFLAGHYIFGNPWDKLIADYNILAGRVWSLVLLTIFLAPYVTKKLLLTH